MMLTFLLFGMLTLASNIQSVKSEPKIIIVPDDYPTIRGAIKAAAPGDTVYVRAGTYYELVFVDKAISLIGESRETTIIDAPWEGNVITVTSDNVIVAGFTARNSYGTGGIVLSQVKNCKISRNRMINNFWDGIDLYSSSNNVLSENDITSNYVGLYLDNHSENNIISRNNMTNNDWWGINLISSPNNVLRDNVMAVNGYNFGVQGEKLSDFINDVDTSNTVNGKPVYYWIKQQNRTVPSDAGYVAIINSKNIRVQNLNMKSNEQGVLLAYTINSSIQNLTIENNNMGIWIHASQSNIISGNRIIDNNWQGIELGYSSNNKIFRNNITSNFRGISLSSSSSNVMAGNNITGNNQMGITLYLSSRNVILGNNITSNINDGIWPDESPNNIIIGNNIANHRYGDGIWLTESPNSGIIGNNIEKNEMGIHADYSSGSMVLGNNISGNFYWGGIWFFHSNNVVIFRNNIESNNGEGIYIASETSGNWITGNNITSNEEGMRFYDSSSNSITRNNVENNEYGIVFEQSSGSRIFHNSFVNNTYQVSSSSSMNTWDDGYPSGGNHWSDYTGVDFYSGPYQNETGADGIGDTPYTIDVGNNDRYPLMKPYKPQHILVYTDKNEYYTGDTMQLGLFPHQPLKLHRHKTFKYNLFLFFKKSETPSHRWVLVSELLKNHFEGFV